MISAGPKQDFQLHATPTLPVTIKALQTTKIKILGLLSLPIGFEQKVLNIRIEKQI